MDGLRRLRRGRDLERSLTLLRRGTQFAPAVVDACTARVARAPELFAPDEGVELVPA